MTFHASKSFSEDVKMKSIIQVLFEKYLNCLGSIFFQTVWMRISGISLLC